MARILLIDDDASLLRVTQHNLSRVGHDVLCADSAAAGLSLLECERVDVVVTNLQMPGKTGLELLSELSTSHPTVVTIIITAHSTVRSAVEAMKLGAHDYITKPFDRESLAHTVAKAVEFKRLRDENLCLRQELEERYGLDNVVGLSEAITNLKATVAKVAGSDSTVLLTGESGTGKELIARAIHGGSLRATKSFVAVNCPAIPESLMESELFGHEKGAFTGATRDRAGKFVLADGGTIFLDEISDLKADAQAKLLRVLQEKEIDKVGSARPVPVDVRVIAATNQDLEEKVRVGEFREDLYYRISVIPVVVPPLRHREGDVSLLVGHFLRQHGAEELTVEPEAMRLLEGNHWRGNVRELRNVIERCLVLRAQPECLKATDLPAEIRQAGERPAETKYVLPEGGVNMADLEKALVLQALERTDWSQTKAASLLGLTRQTLIYRMEKHGIRRKPDGRQ